MQVRIKQTIKKTATAGRGGHLELLAISKTACFGARRPPSKTRVAPLALQS